MNDSQLRLAKNLLYENDDAFLQARNNPEDAYQLVIAAQDLREALRQALNHINEIDGAYDEVVQELNRGRE